jgi:hypothetical protein
MNERDVNRNAIQHGWIEDIDARVDLVANILLGFFDEFFNLALFS